MLSDMTEKLFFGAIVLLCLVVIALWIVLAVVAIHFITKWW